MDAYQSKLYLEILIFNHIQPPYPPHPFLRDYKILAQMSLFLVIRILACHPKGLPSSLSFHYSLSPLLSIVNIRAFGHSVLLVMQIVEGSRAQVYAKVLHACF
jgi:hypothetical protein